MIPKAIDYVSSTVWGLLLRETIGSNIPRVALTRNEPERFDAALTQFGATAAFFGGGWVLSALLKPLHQNLLHKNLAPRMMGWSHLGRSLGIYSMLGGMMWSVPFFRNYLIAKRYKTTDFTAMVGEKRIDPNEVNSQEYKDKLSYFKNTGLTCVTIGAGLALAFLGATSLAMKNKLPLTGASKWFNDKLGLVGGNFNNFTRSKVNLSFTKSTPFQWFKNRILTNTALLFWTVPIYGGWIHASRDKNERNECLVKLGAFLLDFYFVPELLEKGIFKLAKGRKIPVVGSAENLAFLSKFVSSMIFATTASSLVGIWLTRRKEKQKQALQEKQQNVFPLISPALSPTMFNPYVQASSRMFNPSGAKTLAI
jgi:hypothetical protein